MIDRILNNVFTLLLCVCTSAIIFLIFAIIILPIHRVAVTDQIVQFNSIKQTIEISRMENIKKLNETGIITFDNASMILEIMKSNAWLTSVQYWNNSIFDWYWPDEVDQLQPLR